MYCYHNRKHLIIRRINVYHTKYLLLIIWRVIMSNKLNFHEHIQFFNKKQKKKTGRQAILGLFVTGFLIFTYVLFAGSSVAKVEDKDNKFTASFVGDMMFGRHVNDIIEERG